MNLSKLSASQIVNLSLAVFLLLGIAATTYTVKNITDYNAEAAKGGRCGSRRNPCPPTTASVKLDQTDTHLGDLVTFTTTGGSWIKIQCHKSISEPMWGAEGPTGTSFVLGGDSSIWKTVGGSVSCVANLYSGSSSSTVLATTGWYSGGAR